MLISALNSNILPYPSFVLEYLFNSLSMQAHFHQVHREQTATAKSNCQMPSTTWKVLGPRILLLSIKVPCLPISCHRGHLSTSVYIGG